MCLALMEPLTRLKSLLSRGEVLGERQLTPSDEIDRVLRQLEVSAKGAGSQKVPVDLQQEAVRRFWQSMRLDSLREGRLVSFGVCLPNVPGGPCVLEDRHRFAALLDGVDQWVRE